MINVKKMTYNYKMGLILSLAYLVLTSFQVVFSRFSIVEYSISPAVSIILALMVGSFVQLAYAGSGYGLFFIRTLKNGYTWLYTIMQLFMNIAGIYILVYITTTEAFLLQRLAIIVSLIMGFLFLNRSIKSRDFIGIGLILLGIGLVLSGFDKVTAITVFLLVVIAGSMSAGRTLIAEIHPIYNQAKNNLERIRCTGVITLISSVLFLGFIFILSYIKSVAGADVEIQIIQWAPNLDQFFNKHNFYYGIIIGFFVTPLDTWLFFRKSKLLTAEVSMMTTAFLPFIILLTEYIFSKLGLLDITGISKLDMVAGLIIVSGAIYLMVSRFYDNKTKLSKKEKSYVKDAKVLALAGLEFAKNNNEKLAKLLNINIELLDNILEERAILNKEDLDNIRKNFAEKIALFDSLTGLQNRMHFKGTLHNLADNDSVSLLFLDLNKFKPVNDKYGHEAGDELLQQVALRLNKTYPHAYITRFGGDEFCLLFANKNKYQAKQLVKDIKSLISIPFNLDLADVTVEISTSIGVSSYPEDVSSVNDLIALADSKMYEDKS